MSFFSVLTFAEIIEVPSSDAMIKFSVVIQIVSSIECSRSGLRKNSYRLVVSFAKTINSAIAQNEQFQALKRKTYANIINPCPNLVD